MSHDLELSKKLQAGSGKFIFTIEMIKKADEVDYFQGQHTLHLITIASDVLKASAACLREFPEFTVVSAEPGARAKGFDKESFMAYNVNVIGK